MANVPAKGLQDSVEVVGSKFEDVALSGDVAYFEFCLHEMADPNAALTHAKDLAPDRGIRPFAWVGLDLLRCGGGQGPPQRASHGAIRIAAP